MDTSSTFAEFAAHHPMFAGHGPNTLSPPARFPPYPTMPPPPPPPTNATAQFFKANGKILLVIALIIAVGIAAFVVWRAQRMAQGPYSESIEAIQDAEVREDMREWQQLLLWAKRPSVKTILTEVLSTNVQGGMPTATASMTQSLAGPTALELGGQHVGGGPPPLIPSASMDEYPDGAVIEGGGASAEDPYFSPGA